MPVEARHDGVDVPDPGIPDQAVLGRYPREFVADERRGEEAWGERPRSLLSLDEDALEPVKRPYDPCHTGISFWSASEVDPAACARRAGQRIRVLLRCHARFSAEERNRANRLIEQAMQRREAPKGGTIELSGTTMREGARRRAGGGTALPGNGSTSQVRAGGSTVRRTGTGFISIKRSRPMSGRAAAEEDSRP